MSKLWRWLVVVLLCLFILGSVSFGFLLQQNPLDLEGQHSLTSPAIGIFYYIWYGAIGDDWASPKFVDFPVIGNYSSCNSSVIKHQLTQIEDLGVDFVVISWWGDHYGDFMDNATGEVFKAAQTIDSSLKFVLMVEPFNLSGSSYDDGASLYDYAAIYNKIWQSFVLPYSEYYYNIDNEPVICFFNSPSLTDDGIFPRDDRFNVITVGQQKYTQWIYTDLNYMDLPQHDPLDQISVTPRYDESFLPDREGNVAVDRYLNQTVYDAEWKNASELWIRGDISTILITSWNEYPERTAIEPHYDKTSYSFDPYFLYKRTKEHINEIRSMKTAASLPGDFVGISLHSLNESDAQYVVESGADWVRIDADPTLGVDLANAKAQNLKVLCILGSWMFNGNTVFDIEAWEAEVKYYVSNFKDYVDAWEIWNEPALSNFDLLTVDSKGWENITQMVQARAYSYYSMVLKASPIIRQMDPTAMIVLLGGLQLYSDSNQTEIDKSFALELSSTNLSSYGDAISVHAYSWNRDFQNIQQEYSESLEYYTSLFPISSVLVTETGKPIEEAGEDGQAEYLQASFNFFKGKVAHVFWYSLYDNKDEFEREVDGKQSSQHFGLIGEYLKPRRSYSYLKSMLNC